MKKYCRILSVAGSDSGGGAGIQADIKTISACGCYAETAVTAVTVQNTLGVSAIHPLPPDIVSAQILAVYEDIGADAVKTGMFYSAETVAGAADALRRCGAGKLVVDPVMVSTSGSVLLEKDALESLIKNLFPLAVLITPNITEASAILGREIKRQDELDDAAREISAMSGSAVLVKAGHIDSSEITDVMYDPSSGFSYFKSARVDTQNTHGTGCVLSSAIASYLGKGKSLGESVALAKKYIDGALRAGSAYKLGQGHGPLHHFYKFWE
jgi:hydroxymethylpyrimidine/phosphomethylpyrimidine kinase